MRGMGASDGLVARFGKAEIKNLAFADQVLHCAGDVLDWHARVHAMLIQQIDVIGLEPVQGSIHDQAYGRSRHSPTIKSESLA